MTAAIQPNEFSPKQKKKKNFRGAKDRNAVTKRQKYTSIRYFEMTLQVDRRKKKLKALKKHQ